MMSGSTGAYGHRARIGYTSVAFVTEVYPIEFYRMAPDGVTLSLITLEQVSLTASELDRIYVKSLAAARTLAEADVDVIVLGGRPVMLTRGLDGAYALLDELSAELGKPVTSEATAQIEAFEALGSRNCHPNRDEDRACSHLSRKALARSSESIRSGARSGQIPTEPE